MKMIKKFCFVALPLILLAANANAGRWLTRDPIAFMERDPKPTVPGSSASQSPPNDIQLQINLYAYVENNPVNEIDPMGLWNLWAPWTWGVSDGIGTSLGNSLNPFDASAGWGGFSLETSSEADAAFLDGIIPFWDPFSNLYDSCDKGLQWSKSIGGYTRDAELIVWAPEIKINNNLRIAPFGNRTSNPIGNLPHYHRRILGPDGQTIPGGAIGWHRPWENGF